MPVASEDQQPTLRPTLRLLAARHPVAAFLVMAYAFAWVSLLPALLSEQGFGLLPVGAPVQLSVLLSSVLGLTLPAFLVTAARDGKAGVRDLLRRCLRWRVGVRWYLLALFGLLVATLLGAGAFLGAAPFGGIVQKWHSLFSAYLPGLLALFVLGNMWEEIGYTGFLQDTLQERHGPLLAGVLVAPAFALMHLPALFVSGWVLDEGFSLVQFPAALLTVGLLAVLAVFFRTLTGWALQRRRAERAGGGALPQRLQYDRRGSVRSGVHPRCVLDPHGGGFGARRAGRRLHDGTPRLRARKRGAVWACGGNLGGMVAWKKRRSLGMKACLIPTRARRKPKLGDHA